MPAVQRLGDTDSGGGVITRGDTSVTVDGIPIAVTGCPVTPHPYYHSGVVTIANQNTVFVNGVPVVTTGATDSCGHSRVGGSSTVFIGG